MLLYGNILNKRIGCNEQGRFVLGRCILIPFLTRLVKSLNNTLNPSSILIQSKNLVMIVLNEIKNLKMSL